MVVIAGALAAAVLALVILYLTQPVYRKIKVSVARFFLESPRSNESKLRISLKSLLLSRPFYLQLLALLLLLGGLVLLVLDQNITRPGQHVGVWVVVDTSGSMSVADGKGSRLDAAREAVGGLMARLEAFPADVDKCVSVYTFDMELKPLSDDVAPNSALDALQKVRSRGLASNVSILKPLVALAERAAGTGEEQPEGEAVRCVPTYIVVYSDLPAPELAVDATVPVIWEAIGAPAANVGLLTVQRDQGLLPGAGQGLRIEVAGYGEPVAGAALVVSDAAGREVQRQPVGVSGGVAELVRVPLTASGVYTVSVAPGGAYGYDDAAAVRYDTGDTLRVAWGLPDRTLPDSLGWQIDFENPSLAVAAYGDAGVDGVPTLFVGDGYGQAAPAAISYFAEGHALLQDLNFDVAESLGIRGAPQPLAGKLAPVMFNEANSVWFAAGEDEVGAPLAAYVPGLPQSTGDTNLDAFSTTAFFNAVRYLLQVEAPPLACKLTSPSHPQADAEYCSLHPGEGDTTLVGPGAGNTAEIVPASGVRTRERMGPWLVLAALAVFLLERSLNAFGGAAWR